MQFAAAPYKNTERLDLSIDFLGKIVKLPELHRHVLRQLLEDSERCYNQIKSREDKDPFPDCLFISCNQACYGIQYYLA
jgi:hypothetical protein